MKTEQLIDLFLDVDLNPALERKLSDCGKQLVHILPLADIAKTVVAQCCEYGFSTNATPAEVARVITYMAHHMGGPTLVLACLGHASHIAGTKDVN